jgi:hypothetical protein
MVPCLAGKKALVGPRGHSSSALDSISRYSEAGIGELCVPADSAWWLGAISTIVFLSASSIVKRRHSRSCLAAAWLPSGIGSESANLSPIFPDSPGSLP